MEEEMVGDLISRSALMEDIIKRFRCRPYIEVGNKCEYVHDILDEQPTIEAVPVVHGQWEICEKPNSFDTYGNPTTYARCTVCGFTWSDKYSVRNYFKHCPNCGAKMEGGA